MAKKISKQIFFDVKQTGLALKKRLSGVFFLSLADKKALFVCMIIPTSLYFFIHLFGEWGSDKRQMLNGFDLIIKNLDRINWIFGISLYTVTV